MTLTNYRTLGRSGLVVSPLALGTMTFGTARWGLDEAGSAAVFNAYVEAGGNFVDTADVYAAGRSEEMLGKFIADQKLRDQIVIATKAGFAAGKGVHTGGNGAKHVHAALEGSLKRLRTDHIDLFWIHVWDSVTPAEELLETMAGLVRAGKVRYWGMSNAPAWYVTKLATLAAERGVSGPIALQYFYSLVNRDIEEEHIPLAKEFGMGVVPWSPLAYGLLTGKYDRSTVEAAPARAGGLPRDAAPKNERRPEGDKRLDGANPFGDFAFYSAQLDYCGRTEEDRYGSWRDACPHCACMGLREARDRLHPHGGESRRASDGQCLSIGDYAFSTTSGSAQPCKRSGRSSNALQSLYPGAPAARGVRRVFRERVAVAETNIAYLPRAGSMPIREFVSVTVGWLLVSDPGPRHPGPGSPLSFPQRRP